MSGHWYKGYNEPNKESLALDDEIKELKAENRMHRNSIIRLSAIVEDLREKLLERDERIKELEDYCDGFIKELKAEDPEILQHLEYMSEPCREELQRIIGEKNK